MVDENKKFYSDDVIKELVEYRKKHKITQQNVAEKSGIMRSNIARLESMKSEPSMDILSRYANALGMDIKISLVKKKHKG